MSAWAGAMVTGASVSLLISQSVIGIILLTHPHITFQAWHAFLGYQLVNLATMIFNCYSQILPFLTSSSLYISLFSFITITVSILTVSPTMASASEVFGLAGYTNASGWSSHAINVFTGLLGVNWGFSCLDACTHMAEESRS